MYYARILGSIAIVVGAIGIGGRDEDPKADPGQMSFLIHHRVDEKKLALAAEIYKRKTGKDCLITESRASGQGKAYVFLAMEKATEKSNARLFTLTAIEDLSDLEEHAADRFFWLTCNPVEIALMYAPCTGANEKLYLFSCFSLTNPIGNLDAEFIGVDTLKHYELKIRAFTVINAGIKKPESK